MSHFNAGSLLHNQQRGSIVTSKAAEEIDKPERSGALRASRSSTGVHHHPFDKQKSHNNSFKNPSKFDFSYH